MCGRRRERGSEGDGRVGRREKWKENGKMRSREWRRGWKREIGAKRGKKGKYREKRRRKVTEEPGVRVRER